MYEDSIQNSSRSLTIQHIKLNDIEKAISTKIENKISSIKKANVIKEKVNGVENRFEYNSNLDIYIDTENGKLVNDNGKISYTFPIFRKNEDKLENIIFAETNSNDIEIYIAKYNVNPEVFKELTLSEQTAYLPELQKMYFTGGDIVVEYICIEFITTVTTYGNCPYPGGVHSNGQTCNGESVSYSTSFCSIVTSGGGGGGYSGGNNTGGYSGGSNTGDGHGGGSGTGSNGVSTSPVLNLNDIETKKFIKSIPESLENCFTQNEGVQDDILNYVSENGFSEESTQFALSVLSEICSSNNPNLPSNVQFFLGNVLNNINNINDYLKCFDLTQPASFTIWVDQPTANSNTAWSGNPLSQEGPNVGHTFISIKQGNIRRVLGFYPSTPVDLENPASPGVLQNNSAHEFDVSLSVVISPTKLSSVINYIKTKSDSIYNLNSYNCTDFGMGLANLAGISLASAYGTWSMVGIGSGGGDNP